MDCSLCSSLQPNIRRLFLYESLWNTVRELHQSIAHSQLDRMDNIGHMVLLEQPENLAANILKWLNILSL